jgi:HSP20 family molecular chaperone IbpA
MPKGDNIMFADFDSMFTLLEELDKMGTKKVDPKRFEKRLCTNSYPPSNVYVDGNGNYVIEVALCGLKPGKDYEATMSNNILTLKIKNDNIEKSCHYLQRGLRIPSQCEVKWLVDDKSVNLNKFDTSFDNGLFRIVFKKKEIEKASEFKII